MTTVTLDQAREAVQQRWVTQWASATVTTFEDEVGFKEPASAPWAELRVRNLRSDQETLGSQGNRIFRRKAVVLVTIRVPNGRGMKTSANFGHAARNIFEGVSFSGLDFGAVLVREAGSDGKWNRTIVEAAFDYDDLK